MMPIHHSQAMFGFKSYKDEVLNHWIAFADGFQFPPSEFYQAVEQRLKERNLPGLEISHVEYAEGGLLSMKRVYLRMMRERLAFDTCATPFGNTYLFSCRATHSVPIIQLWHLLALMAVGGGTLLTFLAWLGFIYGCIAFGSLMVALLWTLLNARVLRIGNLDQLILNTPAIGPIYELWIRKETYYRKDTRLAYLNLVPKIIEELANETTSAKGVKLTRQYESTPIFGGIYKPVTPKSAP